MFGTAKAGFMALKRSTRDVMIAGVCAGLAHELGWPVSRTRIAYVVFSMVSAGFRGIVAYLLLWLVMPKSNEW